MAESSKEKSPLVSGRKESDDKRKHSNSNSNSEDANFELSSNISDDDSDEVSLLVVDDQELTNIMQEAGISVEVSRVPIKGDGILFPVCLIHLRMPSVTGCCCTTAYFLMW